MTEPTLHYLQTEPLLWRVAFKEYILVIEVTAPAIVLQICDSPNLSMPALADGQAVAYLQTEREEVG